MGDLTYDIRRKYFMRDFGAMRGAPWTVGDILRRMLLSWLTAVLDAVSFPEGGSSAVWRGWRALAAQSVLLLLGMGSISFLRSVVPPWQAVLKRFG